MGQTSSHPERGSAPRQSRRMSMGPSLPRTDDGEDGLLHSPTRPRDRSTTANRFSQLIRSSSHRSQSPRGIRPPSQRRDLLQRTTSSLRNILHHDMLDRRTSRHTQNSQSSRPLHGLLHHRASYVRAGMRGDAGEHYRPPQLPPLDISSTFDHDTFDPPNETETLPGSSSSNRRSTLRFNALRPDRPFRHFPSLRRRRSPQRSSSARRPGGSEDQAALLSRLLSVAAAATAATLMGDNHQAMSEARSLSSGAGFGELGGSAGEDGSFDGFLRALQNGRIASALRQGNDAEDTAREGPLNFFRMFRFGASATTNESRASNNPQVDDPSMAPDAAHDRMIPIIIVGIRSISPNSGTGTPSAVDELPPFIDALSNLPSPAHLLGAHDHDSIDSILRPPQNGTSFRHRRRASMGGLGMSRNRINDRLDDQRDHRSPDRRRERPWSVASSLSNLDPRPPPATPASPSPELSRISSRNSTPDHSRPASLFANGMRDFPNDSRRNSVLHRASQTNPLSAHTEETVSSHSASRSNDNLLSPQPDSDSFPYHSHRRFDAAPNVHYPRFASGHPRRNGVVEPDNLPSLSRTSTSNATDASTNNPAERRSSSNDSRSWIIYVLGGSYPENHPILTTPSLFTENPTYEDMMLLSALLGPAKAPVASDEDVQLAGGVYNIELEGATEETIVGTDSAKIAQLVAVAIDGSERVDLENHQRCLVCLSDFEVKEIGRKLVKCNHLFHKECIDQWLTQGRNSCPLCRGQGVDEKQTSPGSTEETPVTDGSPRTPVELQAGGSSS